MGGGAGGLEPQYSQHMGSKETNDLNFLGQPHQASEAVVSRSSYGAGGGLMSLGAPSGLNQ